MNLGKRQERGRLENEDLDAYRLDTDLAKDVPYKSQAAVPLDIVLREQWIGDYIYFRSRSKWGPLKARICF